MRALPDEPDPPVSPDVLEQLHRDLLRRKRRTFLLASPLLVLAGVAWVVSLQDPRHLGGMAFFAVVIVAMIAQVGYEWWELHRADPVQPYEREQADEERRHAELIAHEARTATVRPIASLSLTAAILLVTAVQIIWRQPQQWLTAGALVKPAVRAGEWWRLLTASYLHGSVMHILANAGALLMLGRLIETYDRRLRIPLIYLLSAIGGNVVSTLAFPQPGLGASGGILGLAGYLVVVARRPGAGIPEFVRRRMLSILGMAALTGTAAYYFIDNAAHAGGAITGALLALLLPPAQPSDPFDGVDMAGVLASVVLAGGAAFTIYRLLAA